MRPYRFDHRDESRAVYSDHLMLADDKAALEHAQHLSTEFDIEVWCEGRLVGRIGKRPLAATARCG